MRRRRTGHQMRLPGCCTLALVAALAFAPPAHAHAIVPGRVLVGFSSRADAGSRAASRSAAGARLVRHVGRAQLLAVPRGEVRAAVRELRGRRGVRYAQPDYVGHVAVVPDDAYYTPQQWNMAKIGMPAAWDVTIGSPAVKLAILDTGIDLDHPELAGQIDSADGYDVVDGDATPDDPPDATKAIGHGTHVAGIAGALGDNALGVAGVSWDSSLIALRVCGKDGTCAASAIADGITRAGAAGARVANLSIDGLGPSTAVSDAIAGAPGTLFVVSAGNGDRNVDTTPDYPCSFPAPNLVCVAASDEDDALQSRSNWGADSVDLAAPGNAIWSTVTGGGYGSKTGTSMASPHVAGAAALLWADAPTATVAQVRGALLGSVDPTGAPVATGGRLDVAAALQALPGVVVDSGPADGSSSQLASVGFHAAPSGTAFECRFDDAPAFSPCTPPYDASAAADGPHTLDVRAVTGGVTVRRAWTLDRVAPTVTLSDAPSGTLPRRRATVAFEPAGDPASVRCSIDGAAFEDCISPLSPAGLADGPHTVEVQATDAAGNAGSAVASWSVDAAPLTVIGDHPAALSASSSARFEFSAAGATGFRCSLDGAAFAPCASGDTWPALGDGAHEFRVGATDATHPDDEEWTAVAWTVDTVPPDVAITGGPAGTVGSRSASVPFTVGEGLPAECALDGGAFAPCSSPFAVSGLADGAHLVTVRARDAAGNLGTASRSWTVDATAPSVVVESASSGDGSASFAFRADDGALTTCALDNGTFAPCTSPASYGGLADGHHVFVVRAADALGNTSSAAREFDLSHPPPAATAAPSPAATPAPVAPPAGVARAVVAKLRGRSPAAVARLPAFRVGYRARAAGTLLITVRLGGAGTILSGRSQPSSAHTVRPRVARTAAAARVATRRSATLTVVARFTPADRSRAAVAATRRVTVRRP